MVVAGRGRPDAPLLTAGRTGPARRLRRRTQVARVRHRTVFAVVVVAVIVVVVAAQFLFDDAQNGLLLGFQAPVQ